MKNAALPAGNAAAKTPASMARDGEPPASEPSGPESSWDQEPARLLRAVWERRFCDQHEISLHTATGRSLP